MPPRINASATPADTSIWALAGFNPLGFLVFLRISFPPRTRPASQALKKTTAGRLVRPVKSTPLSTSLPAQISPDCPGLTGSKKAWPA
jgi:hypothetical protein